jgi:TPR repeat protein
MTALHVRNTTCTVATAMVLTLFMAAAGQALGGWDEAVEADRRGDYATAFREYSKLAEAQEPYAFHNVGVMYNNGYGVHRDYEQAVKWYRKAAERGVASSQNNMGYMYAKGHGVPQDLVKAHMWFYIADANGEQSAIDNMRVITSILTPEQIEQAETLARNWLAKSRGQSR